MGSSGSSSDAGDSSGGGAEADDSTGSGASYSTVKYCGVSSVCDGSGEASAKVRVAEDVASEDECYVAVADEASVNEKCSGDVTVVSSGSASDAYVKSGVTVKASSAGVYTSWAYDE